MLGQTDADSDIFARVFHLHRRKCNLILRIFMTVQEEDRARSWGDRGFILFIVLTSP
jgi:hypothetical protein